VGIAASTLTITNRTVPKAGLAPKLAVMDSQITQRIRLLKGLDPDRRGNVRYPLNLEVRYTVVGHRGPAENGSGRTIDMSISGLSFTADRPLSIGQRLDLSIEWPVLLDGGVQLQLVTSGVVVRSAGAVLALRIARPEFRTKRAGLKVEPRPASVG
jgi:hypothetical protein